MTYFGIKYLYYVQTWKNLTMKKLSMLDLAFFMVESEASPKHVAGLMRCKKPRGAKADYARKLVEELKTFESRDAHVQEHSEQHRHGNESQNRGKEHGETNEQKDQNVGHTVLSAKNEFEINLKNKI